MMPSIVSATTHHFFTDFTITQNNPQPAGSATGVTTIKQAPEIAYFEDLSDIAMVQFLSTNPFATFTTELSSSGISGGAADMLGITSSAALHYAGDGAGSMLLSSFNGSSYLFDPQFSNYYTLVFDVYNTGSTDIAISPRIGSDGINANSAMYAAFDSNFNPVNVRTLAAGDIATFVFNLGKSLPNDTGTVWDYTDDPYNQIQLDFQAINGVGFDLLIDNIGMMAVPEPGSILLCLFGGVVLRKLAKTKKN